MDLLDVADVRKPQVCVYLHDTRYARKPKLTAKNESLGYAYRPLQNREVRYLSAYELYMYWELKLAVLQCHGEV